MRDAREDLAGRLERRDGVVERRRPLLRRDRGDLLELLREAGVAVSPGVDFDRTRGNRFLRFSYCGPEADMVEAAARLKGWQ